MKNVAYTVTFNGTNFIVKQYYRLWVFVHTNDYQVDLNSVLDWKTHKCIVARTSNIDSLNQLTSQQALVKISFDDKVFFFTEETNATSSE